MTSAGLMDSQGGWTPLAYGTSTLHLWLDASKSSNFTLVSTAVSQWNDSSGNNRNFSQATSGSRPTFTTNFQNGLSVVSFDGSTDFMTASAISLTSNFTCVMAVRGNTANRTIFSPGRAGNSGWGIQTAGSSSNYAFVKYGVVQLDTTVANVGATFSIISWKVASDLKPELRVNGGTSIWTSTNTQGINATGFSCYLGSTNDGTSTVNYWPGYLGELVLTSAAPSTAETTRMEGYLAHKWGLIDTFPVTHPYRYAKP